MASTSRGLVGDTVFAVLPNIKPIHTFVITIAFQSVSNMTHVLLTIITFCLQIVLIKLWVNPTYKSFLTALTLCGYASYLFGWHVHEKAVLLILVPLRYIDFLTLITLKNNLPMRTACSLQRGTHTSAHSSCVVPQECSHCFPCFSHRQVIYFY